MRGSSPREWGTHPRRPDIAAAARFIPTRVGNTIRRVAGVTRNSGSSPREWGTLRHPLRSRPYVRFIPTRVGNTQNLITTYQKNGVHPHASGEHMPPDGSDLVVLGSSPREWGTLFTGGQTRCHERFIPTRVGNTLARASRVSGMSVHPHASGEHAGARKRSSTNDGSSPREWGTLSRTQRR